MTWKLLQHQLAVVGDVLAIILCVCTIFLLNYSTYIIIQITSLTLASSARTVGVPCVLNIHAFLQTLPLILGETKTLEAP